jgi:hypothetical protein
MLEQFNEALVGTAPGVVLLGIMAGLLVDYIRKKL